MWPFKPKHKLQCNGGPNGPKREVIIEKLPNGKIYFDIFDEKHFLTADNNVEGEPTYPVTNIIPMTWPENEPCPLFKDSK